MGLTAEAWARLKSLKVVPVPAPDKNSKHVGSVLVDKVSFKRPSFWRRITGAHREPVPTNNQRVVMSRAARMGISVKEYEIKYPSDWKTERAYDEYLNGLLDKADIAFQQAQTTNEPPF